MQKLLLNGNVGMFQLHVLNFVSSSGMLYTAACLEHLTSFIYRNYEVNISGYVLYYQTRLWNWTHLCPTYILVVLGHFDGKCIKFIIYTCVL